MSKSFDKDKFDANMALAQFGASRWDQRRNIEWRVTFGIWALLAASAAIKEIKPPLWAGPLLFFVYVFFWLRGLWLANEADRILMRLYLNRAQSLLRSEPPIGLRTPKDTSWCSFLGDWAMWFQAISTGVLIFMVYAIKGW